MKLPPLYPGQEQEAQPAMDPKVMAAIINAQERERDRQFEAVQKERDRDTKLMDSKLKLAANLVVHPESEAMLDHFLDTDQVPLYEETP